MMKFLKILFVCTFVFVASSFTFAQSNSSKGINFSSISFKEALKKAEKSNKLIFVDAYTTWCGPCKRMSQITFKNEKVGEKFNKNFINLQIDMEKGEGLNFARKYRVRAYPTMFLINSDGKVVKRILGYMTADKLLAQVNEYLN